MLPILTLLFFCLSNLPSVAGVPLRIIPATLVEAEGGMPPDKPTFWIYLAVAVALVLLGGVFAGLTIALMGQVCSSLPYLVRFLTAGLFEQAC